jgi:hypothetical protein
MILIRKEFVAEDVVASDVPLRAGPSEAAFTVEGDGHLTVL